VTDLDARVENAMGRTLAGAGWFVPLSVRRDVAQAVLAVVREEDEPDPAEVYGDDLTPPLCCCRRGLMCGSCGTGHHWDCPDREDQDDDYESSDEEEDDEP
jgi:hypothetical protein